MPGRRILVIGGAGYVGSHFTRYAVQSGLSVTVLDNLSTGHAPAVTEAVLIRGDLLDREFLSQHLRENRYDALFHFAASCLVGESVEKPALYYENNVLAAYSMLEAMRATGHDRVIFSSTCAVYGEPQSIPISEEHPKNPVSPYGRTKRAIEWMLEDYQRAYGIRSAALRYFNAAGCEPQDGLGEDHTPESHLIPNVVRYALGLDARLVIFGNDYPTPDGTCIRDYIHVTDLAEAHLKALAKLDSTPLIQLNLGTGSGFSNLGIVEAVSKAVNKQIEFEFGPRRPGDPPELVADATRAFEMLEWKPSRSNVNTIVEQVVQWFSEHPEGYPD
jgi:UDP-glucose 4-epimerase